MNDNYKKYLEEDKQRFHEWYKKLLRFKSISSEEAFGAETQACSEWLKKELEDLGFVVKTWGPKERPVLFGEQKDKDPSQPTLLIYNHYDVQPVDPIEAWETPPFEPTVRGNEVYARGAQDNKGQLAYVLQAIRLIKKIEGKLPINIKFCIEGEEEIGSPALSKLAIDHAVDLKSDFLIVVDVGIPTPETPAVTIGVRGLTTMDIEVIGPKCDAHSGQEGGLLLNPIQALVQLLSRLHDKDGRVTIPGFYDKVKPLNAMEKTIMHQPFDEKGYFKLFGVKPYAGEQTLPPLERVWGRPTIEFNGINGGYTKDGFKTVIPHKATAKVSCRLVADQDPLEVGHLVKDFLEKNAPLGSQVKVNLHEGCGMPLKSDPDSTIVRATKEAYEEVFDKRCDLVYDGGSIPVIAQLSKASHAQVAFIGLGLSSDAIHAPNEHFGLDRLDAGCLIIASLIQRLKK